MKAFAFGSEQSDLILIQMVDSHSIKMLDSEEMINAVAVYRVDVDKLSCKAK